MECSVANEITRRLIGISVNFTYFGQTVYYNNYISVTLSSSIIYSDGSDSYFRITFNPLDYIIPNISFSIFDIKPRAKEFGMKLKRFIHEGEVFINSSMDKITIVVNVFKVVHSNSTQTGSVIIKISLPNNRNNLDYCLNYAYEDEEEKEYAKKIGEAFRIGALAVGGIIVAKIIKGGIGAILGGPVGAVLGFAI